MAGGAAESLCQIEVGEGAKESHKQDRQVLKRTPGELVSYAMKCNLFQMLDLRYNITMVVHVSQLLQEPRGGALL
jgi:hypothetical protein